MHSVIFYEYFNFEKTRAPHAQTHTHKHTFVYSAPGLRASKGEKEVGQPRFVATSAFDVLCGDVAQGGGMYWMVNMYTTYHHIIIRNTLGTHTLAPCLPTVY